VSGAKKHRVWVVVAMVHRAAVCFECQVLMRVSAARTAHYGLPLYLRVRKSHTHEHMAMESELSH
jgi:hypothetical protein